MKRITLVLSILAIGSLAAQAQTRFGIKGGYTGATWGGDLIDKDERKINSGFHAGFLADIPMGNQLFFQPNLLFNRKGVAVKHEDHTDRINVSAIDIPLNLVLKANGENAFFFVGTGPQLGLNLKAVVKEDGETEDLSIGSGDNDDLKGLDFGWNLLAGIEWRNGLFVSWNYTPGIANLSNSGFKARSNFFGMSVGYFFGGKPAKAKR